MSKTRARYGAGMPPFLARGVGPYVYDGAGGRWVDWIASLATVTLGHAREEVTEAMTWQLRAGGTFAMPHPLEAEVGERFLAATGWPAGQVRWCSTGSEATEGAVRIARMATNRDLILSVGYHGWHSTWTAAKPVRPGVPEAFASAIIDVPAGNLDLLAYHFAMADQNEWKAHQIAAVILEPCAERAPDPTYLAAVEKMAHEHGALVISDEIICGFRWHAHGAMLGTCGIRPDLAVYGKAIANGAFPIAAIVGKPEYMQHAWPVSGTANGHPVGLAAVNAVLDVYDTEQPLAALHQAGRTLRLGLAGLALALSRACAYIGGDDPRPVVRIVAATDALSNVGQTLLCQALAQRGVLWHPAGAGNAMVGHGPLVADTLDAFAGALCVVAEALATEHPETWLVGAPSETALAVRP